MTGAAPRRTADGRLDARPTAAEPRRPLGAGLHELDLGPGVEAVLAVPPGEPAPRPLLVFFHGAGGTAAQGLAALGGVAGERGVLVLAPTSAAGTWDLLTGGWGRDVAALDAALDAVDDACAVARVAFAGFSDGASYALSLGLGNGDLVEAVLAFSPGFVAPSAVRGRPGVWISHGTGDRVLPAEVCGRRVARVLRDEGYDVTYEEFDGGHVVPPDLVRRALAWWPAGGT
ncbi:alpha/beta hydrolase [Geodermatophilus sp. SYSU D00691]